MNIRFKAPLLATFLMMAGLSGCGQSVDQGEMAGNQEGMEEGCNRALLSALPAPRSLTVAEYAGTNCAYNQASRFWEKGELRISVQIVDSRAELPSNIAALGMGDMIKHANALSYGMAKGIVDSTRRTLEEVEASPETLAFFGGEAYLPIILKTSIGEDAAVTFARSGGAGPLYSVIDDRFVVTIERSDASEFPDNKAAERAYKPLLDSVNFTFLR